MLRADDIKTYLKREVWSTLDEMIKQTGDATDLVKGDVRIIIDRLDWARL